MEELINSLASFPGVKAVQMMESSGTSIATISNDESLGETYIAALTADIVTKIDDSLSSFMEIDLGYVKNLLVDLENATLLIRSIVPGQIYIVVVCEPSPSNLGLIMLHLEKISQQLANTLGV